MFWRRKHEDRRPVRAEGQPLGDGDVYLLPGQTKRWTELLGDETRELPAVPYSRANPPATASTELIRPFVRGRERTT